MTSPRRMRTERHPAGVLIGCRDCPSYRRVHASASSAAVEWARHLSDCHGARAEASPFLSKRRARGAA